MSSIVSFLLSAFIIVFPLVFIPPPYATYRTPRIIALELFVVLLLNIFIIGRLRRSERKTVKTPADIPIILLLIFLSGSVMFAPLREGSIIHFTMFLSLVSLFFIVLNSVDNFQHVLLIVDAFIGSCFFVSLIGIFENYSFDYWTWSINWGERVDSSFDDPNLFGGYIAMGFALALCRAITPGLKPKTRLPYFIVLPAIVMGLYFSYSRSAWFALISSVAVFAVLVIFKYRYFFTKSLSKIVVIALFASFLLPAIIIDLPGTNPYGISITKRVSSTQDFLDEQGYKKLSLWKTAIEVMRDKPMWGVGLSNYAKFYPKYNQRLVNKYDDPKMKYDVYNDYLELGAEGGIPALLSYIAILILFFASGVRHILKKETDFHHRWLLLGLLCASLIFALHCAYFQFPMKNLPQFFGLWLFMALGFFLMKSTTEQPYISEETGTTRNHPFNYAAPLKWIFILLLPILSIVFLRFFVFRLIDCSLLYRQVIIENSRGNTTSSMELAKQQITTCPNYYNEKLYMYLGLALASRSECQEARDLLETGIKNYPYNIYILNALEQADICLHRQP